MSGTISQLADLLADCDAHGIRLALAAGGGLEVDAPQVALTPDVLARIQAHKRELLTLVPQGWPLGVAIPHWWPEMAGVFPEGFLAEARPTNCRDPDCHFGVAIRWQRAGGEYIWSCPKCGLNSER